MNQLLLKDHLEKLYPFKIIAEMGGVTHASQVLGVSQSSLSHTLKVLEDILQVSLFSRHSRGMSLTAEGSILFNFSKRIFQDVDSVELLIKNTEKENYGFLKVATHETLATHVWPRLIKEIRSSYPNLDISLISGRIDPIINDLMKGDLDVALTVEPLSNPKLVKTLVYTGNLGFFTSFDDKRSSIALEDLDQISILTDNHAHLQQGLSLPQYLSFAGLGLKRNFDLNSFEAAINLAAAGVGICIVPKRNAADAVSEQRIKEIKVRGIEKRSFGEYAIFASHLKDNQNKMLKPFIEEILKLSLTASM